MSLEPAKLDLEVAELLAVGDLIGLAITNGTVDEWLREHEDGRQHHLGAALLKLATELQAAGERVALARV